jgi:hypothetical protein
MFMDYIIRIQIHSLICGKNKDPEIFVEDPE